MPKILAMLAGAGALAFGVAACGGSSSPSSAASAGATTAGAATAAGSITSTTTTAAAAPSGGSAAASGATTDKLTIMAMSNGALMFTKNAYTVKAGTVEITFENSSGEGHNLFLQQGASGKVLGGTPTITSGSRTLTLHLAPGRYTYYCAVPGHRAAGMQGTLTVT